MSSSSAATARKRGEIPAVRIVMGIFLSIPICSGLYFWRGSAPPNLPARGFNPLDPATFLKTALLFSGYEGCRGQAVTKRAHVTHIAG